MKIDRYVETLTEDAGLEVTSVRHVVWGNKNTSRIYIVSARNETYVLKLKQFVPGQQGTSAVKRLFNGLSFRNQLAFYRGTESIPDEKFRRPKLVSTDGISYVLLEYVDLADRTDHVPNFRSVLTQGLVELQLSGVRLELQPFDRVMKLVRSSTWATVRTILTRIQRAYGWRMSLTCLALMIHCSRGQPNLSFSFLMHGDFHRGNILVDKAGNVYFNDFENVAQEKKWILIDIVHYAVDYHTFAIDYELIREYVRRLHSTLRHQHNVELSFNLSAQLRVAFLKRVLQLLVPSNAPDSVRSQAESFLKKILLPHSAYRRWYESNFDALLNCCAGLTAEHGGAE